MIGFHYMGLKKWIELNSPENPKRTLEPRRRLVKCRSVANPNLPTDLPNWAYEDYLYFFPDFPAPDAWRNYANGTQEWEILKREIWGEIIGLKLNIILSDEAFVVDRAHVADFQWEVTSDRVEAYRRYALSRVQASKYQEGQFRMPELIIKNPIHLDRLIPLQ